MTPVSIFGTTDVFFFSFHHFRLFLYYSPRHGLNRHRLPNIYHHCFYVCCHLYLVMLFTWLPYSGCIRAMILYYLIYFKFFGLLLQFLCTEWISEAKASVYTRYELLCYIQCRFNGDASKERMREINANTIGCENVRLFWWCSVFVSKNVAVRSSSTLHSIIPSHELK